MACVNCKVKSDIEGKNKVMRKNRNPKPMNVFVENSQGDMYIHASLQDDLSCRIEGKFVMQNQVMCFIVSSVSRISNVLFQLRIKMNYPTSIMDER